MFVLGKYDDVSGIYVIPPSFHHCSPRQMPQIKNRFYDFVPYQSLICKENQNVPAGWGVPWITRHAMVRIQSYYKCRREYNKKINYEKKTSLSVTLGHYF